LDILSGRYDSSMGTMTMAITTVAKAQKAHDRQIFWRIGMGVRAITMMPEASVIMPANPGMKRCSMTLLHDFLTSPRWQASS
jgi:hypothetical protein